MGLRDPNRLYACWYSNSYIELQLSFAEEDVPGEMAGVGSLIACLTIWRKRDLAASSIGP